MKKQSILLASAALALASLFSSCTKEEQKIFTDVNFVHASPDAPAFVLKVDSTSFLSTALHYGNNAGYRSVEAGARNLAYHVYGFDTIAYTLQSTFEAKKYYSLFLIDSFKKISALLVEDDLGIPADGRARLRFIQLSPNAPKLDVVVSKDSSVMFENVSFKDVQGFRELTPGVYDLDVRVADSNSNYTLGVIPTFVLNNGKSYTLYTQGFVGGDKNTKLSSVFFQNR